MKIEFHPLVAKDWNEIMDYYEQISPTTALRFDHQLTLLLAEIAAHPTKCAPYLGSRVFRRARLKNFPHLVIYRLLSNTIRITTLKHEKRHFSYGGKRK
jgi:plasmid stabilization system protein ParE